MSCLTWTISSAWRILLPTVCKTNSRISLMRFFFFLFIIFDEEKWMYVYSIIFINTFFIRNNIKNFHLKKMEHTKIKPAKIKTQYVREKLQSIQIKLDLRQEKKKKLQWLTRKQSASWISSRKIGWAQGFHIWRCFSFNKYTQQFF